MPIVDVRFVVSAQSEGRTPLAQDIADALGRVFGSAPGRTWVRLHRHDAALYAENDAPVGEAGLPVFATVLLAALPDAASQAEQARAVCVTLAACFERPLERIHLEYAPAGSGRVAFGGVLLK